MILFHKIHKISVLIIIIIVHSTLNIIGQPLSLIVIDPIMENEIRGIASTYQGQKVITLPDEGNPLKLIAKELKESNYDEIHLFLLTKQGSIIFDEINIIPENIQNFSGDFSEWKSITKQEFKIVIHSENLTSGQEGLFLVKKITEFTGREVIVKK
ncbi:MAG: hypothetical protein A2Y71_12105 [Bacteroidetes bacterium RBG_13_42_15]|nr:MAG: hypothetical protein A2Y71_12105 [Bacteroidetes bacterium RBG_13_42_15]